jgi:hypothetical protein
MLFAQTRDRRRSGSSSNSSIRSFTAFQASSNVYSCDSFSLVVIEQEMVPRRQIESKVASGLLRQRLAGIL